MRIVLFNRLFFPDPSATSQMLSDLAFDLAHRGHDVHVVTARVPGTQAGEERVRGVTVHRAGLAERMAPGLAGRALAYVDCHRAFRRSAARLLAAGDVVVIKTDPPLLASSLAALAKSRGARVVAWLQDLFPEVAREYGIPGLRGPSGSILESLRNRSLGRADAVVAVSEGMAARVAALGCVRPDRLQVIHNWADGRALVPAGDAAERARRRWGLDAHFVVGYSGNLGRVHEFRTLLAAAGKLLARTDIAFLVVGDGPRLAEVRAQVLRQGLSNVRFEPRQERAMLAASMAAADVQLSILRPEYEGLVHPSKLYGIMAAARPVVFIGSAGGDTARIVREAGAGLCIATDDGAGLAAALVRLKENASERRAMGRRAREAFDEKFDMPIALARWSALLDRVAAASSPAP